MSSSINSAYAHCDRKNGHVSLEQTEGQCRDKQNCDDAACPLEHEFGHNRFGKALELLAASIATAIDPQAKG